MSLNKPLILLSVVSLLSVSACKKKGEVENFEPVATATEAAPAEHDHTEEIAQMAKNFQRVYFEFDDSELNDTSKTALTANAAIMKAHPRLHVEIQGHADERGTTEYNLALGQRRAASVHRHMVAEGVAPSKMTVISYGEERPEDPANTEVAWSKNRRSEFRITEGADSTVAGTTN